MELRQLRYFVAVAAEGSISRAAARLHIAQPALSRQIHQLEEELGFVLMERQQHGIQLTAAGSAYLLDARDILQRLDDAQERARRVLSGYSATLNIALNPTSIRNPRLPSIFQDFRSRYPDVKLKLTLMNTPDQQEALRAGDIDAGFRFLAPAELTAEFEHRAFDVARVVLAMPKSHPLAGRRKLSLADIADEAFLFPTRVRHPIIYDALMTGCLEGGFAPRIQQEVNDTDTILALVSVGMGVGFVILPVRVGPADNVVLKAISDLKLSFSVALVWRRDKRPAALIHFAEMIEDAAMTEGDRSKAEERD